MTNSMAVAGVLVGGLAISLLVGCTDSADRETGEQAVVAAQPPAHIAWYNGSLEEAFDTARAEQKPLLLYWGADWCPPCNLLKATLFQQPEFIATTDKFVAVYLDGDTDRAQQHADRFGIAAYPAVLLFNTMGDEITRIPGGTAPGDYRQILQRALRSDHTAAEVLAAVLAGESVSEDQWHRLAWYAWGQDGDRILAGREPRAVLRALIAACPMSLAADRTRLELLAMGQWLAAPSGDPARYLAALHRTLNSDDLSRANLSLLMRLSAEQLMALTPGRDERAKLLVNLTARIHRWQEDGALTATERLALWRGKIAVQQASEPAQPLPSQLLIGVKQAVEAEDAKASSHYQRQAVINAASYLLDAAGLHGEATALLEAEVQRSKTPFYFMSALSHRAMQRGDHLTGIRWSRQAWDSAIGQATRTQWGSSHLLNLMQGQPEQVAGIDTVQRKLLAELARGERSLFGRSRERMIRLNNAMSAWAEGDRQRLVVLQRFQGRLGRLCDAQRADCGFLR